MCNNCNQNNCGGCTQVTHICNQCPTTEPCDCAVKDLATDCIVFTNDDIECDSVVVVAKNTILSDALANIASWSCTKFEELANYLRIINTGTGASIYSGDNLIGEKKLRKINSTSPIITVTQNTDDISLEIDSTSLDSFIEANQKTYTVSNIGTGAQVYKDSTVVGNNTQFNARKINTSNSGTGEGVLKTVVENTNDISIIGKTIISTSLNITSTTDEISIEVPIVSEIPALIVNSAYTGDEELGTASKPFKTIQVALDAYVGTGGKGTILDPTNPELLGSIIEIEKGSGTYSFTGDLDYKDLNLSLKRGAILSSTPTGSWLMDFNSFSTTTTHMPKINIEDDAYLLCNKNGFRLVGGDFAIGTNNRKILSISGNSKGTGVVLAGTLESDILFEIDESNLQYVNGGYENLSLNALISTNRGRMFVIKGNGRATCESNLVYFLNDPSAITITNTYPPIELRNSGKLVFNKSRVILGKTALVTYNQLIATYDSGAIQAIDTLFEGDSEYFAYNNSVANTATVTLDSCKMYMITNTSFAGTVSGVWANMLLTNNNMPNTEINPLTTTIIASAINTIGSEIIETLGVYASKASAVTAGLPNGAKFLNRTDITAGSFIVGVEYKIVTIGTTDFTLIGAPSNTVGLYFTATGVGTGTGVASLIRVDIVI